MGAQRINRFSRKSARSLPMLFRGGRLLNNKPIHDDQTGFLYHPAGFPLEVRRKWFNPIFHRVGEQPSEIGIIFESEKYLKPGIYVEITIPLRQAVEKFSGKVVLVRHNGEHFEIGLWLQHREDASRARIVEQVCHIERYLQETKYRDGPYNLNPDRVAAEWISKYAGSVPTL